MLPQKLQHFAGKFKTYQDAITLLQIATHGMFLLNPDSEITRGINYVINNGKIFWDKDLPGFEETKLTHLEYFQLANWALLLMANIK